MCVSNFATSIGLCNFTVKRFMSEKVMFQELYKLAWHIWCMEWKVTLQGLIGGTGVELVLPDNSKDDLDAVVNFLYTGQVTIQVKINEQIWMRWQFPTLAKKAVFMIIASDCRRTVWKRSRLSLSVSVFQLSSPPCRGFFARPSSSSSLSSPRPNLPLGGDQLLQEGDQLLLLLLRRHLCLRHPWRGQRHHNRKCHLRFSK